MIPIGRGNDFAFSIGSPDRWEPPCEAIIGGYSRSIDVGRVWGGFYTEGRYFGNGVGIGIGFDAVVGFEAQKVKYLRGVLSYIIAAIRVISLYDPSCLVEVEMDGTKIQQSVLMVSIINGIRLGGSFFLAPTSQVDDGLFTLCITEKVSKTEILRLIVLFMQGKQVRHPAITNYQASKVKVTTFEGTLPAHADGETLSTQATRLRMEL